MISSAPSTDESSASWGIGADVSSTRSGGVGEVATAAYCREEESVNECRCIDAFVKADVARTTRGGGSRHGRLVKADVPCSGLRVDLILTLWRQRDVPKTSLSLGFCNLT